MIRISKPHCSHLLWPDPGANEQVDERGRVLKVHVVVAGAVLDEDAAGDVGEACGVVHGGGGVGGREEFHVAFGVDCVVEAPVGDGGCDLVIARS